MLLDPLSRYHVATGLQQNLRHTAEMDRLAKASTPEQPDLIERVIQHVWTRLGRPARQVVSRPLPAPSGGLPPAAREDVWPTPACPPGQHERQVIAQEPGGAEPRAA
jgi:hypothetical protein